MSDLKTAEARLQDAKNPTGWLEALAGYANAYTKAVTALTPTNKYNRVAIALSLTRVAEVVMSETCGWTKLDGELLEVLQDVTSYEVTSIRQVIKRADAESSADQNNTPTV